MCVCVCCCCCCEYCLWLGMGRRTKNRIFEPQDHPTMKGLDTLQPYLAAEAPFHGSPGFYLSHKLDSFCRWCVG